MAVIVYFNSVVVGQDLIQKASCIVIKQHCDGQYQITKLECLKPRAMELSPFILQSVSILSSLNTIIKCISNIKQGNSICLKILSRSTFPSSPSRRGLPYGGCDSPLLLVKSRQAILFMTPECRHVQCQHTENVLCGRKGTEDSINRTVPSGHTHLVTGPYPSNLPAIFMKVIKLLIIVDGDISG